MTLNVAAAAAAISLSSSGNSQRTTHTATRTVTAAHPNDDDDLQNCPMFQQNLEIQQSIFHAAGFNAAKGVVSSVMIAEGRPVLRRLTTTVPSTPRAKDDDDDNDGDSSSAAAPINPHAFDKVFASLYINEDERKLIATTENDANAMIVPSMRNHHKKRSFKVQVAYKGEHFSGWQMQGQGTKLPTVQGTLADLLHDMLRGPSPNVKKRRKQEENKRLEVACAGRTDAGVSAIGQVCRMRTFCTPEEASCDDIQERINSYGRLHDDCLHCVSAEEVDTSFHPTFGAGSRSYIYIIDIIDDSKERKDIAVDGPACGSGDGSGPSSQQRVLKACHVELLDHMMRALEGREFDYFALSYGKVKTETTLCTLYRARASLIEHVENDNNGVQNGGQQAICIELTGNRFLRRMVRKLVGTAVREVLLAFDEGYQDGKGIVTKYNNRIIDIIESQVRRQSAFAAPPDGLIFVDAEYNNN